LEDEWDEEDQKIISSCQFNDETIKEYGWNKVLEWMQENKERLNNYGRTWSCIGIKAIAKINVSMNKNTSILQEIESGGLWGIENDSGEEYIEGIKKGQLEELKTILENMGIDTKEFEERIIKDE